MLKRDDWQAFMILHPLSAVAMTRAGIRANMQIEQTSRPHLPAPGELLGVPYRAPKLIDEPRLDDRPCQRRPSFRLRFEAPAMADVASGSKLKQQIYLNSSIVLLLGVTVL
jgi:hypothetical protein